MRPGPHGSERSPDLDHLSLLLWSPILVCTLPALIRYMRSLMHIASNPTGRFIYLFFL
jgi:uncharacterized membrane protein